MNILIGTPIHEVKDYCMEQWLENVRGLQNGHPADVLLVDNSPGPGYIEKVRGYCEKHGIKNYRIVHLEMPDERSSARNIDDVIHERVARSREMIRQEVLSKGYDAWFSWECDQMIPVNALDELIRMMDVGDFVMVNHNNWTREVPPQPNTDLGVSLIKRECLEKRGFILEFGTEPGMPDNWIPGDLWFKRQALGRGDRYMEVYGVIDPILHV